MLTAKAIFMGAAIFSPVVAVGLAFILLALCGYGLDDLRQINDFDIYHKTGVKLFRGPVPPRTERTR